MNKFGLLILLFATVASITEDEIYDMVVSFFRGMAETEEATCAGVLINQKTKIMEIVHAAIDEYKAGADIATVAQNAAVKLMGVDGLIGECNVLAMPAIITKFTSKEGLVEIFQTCIDNIDEIFAYGQEMEAAIKEQNYNLACEKGGHILSIAIDFQVSL